MSGAVMDYRCVRHFWTPALYAYFESHFRLIGLRFGHPGRNAPRGGLYARRPAQAAAVRA